MDDIDLCLRMMGTIELIEKASYGDAEAIREVLRFAGRSVESDLRKIKDPKNREIVKAMLGKMMEEV